MKINSMSQLSSDTNINFLINGRVCSSRFGVLKPAILLIEWWVIMHNVLTYVWMTKLVVERCEIRQINFPR